MHCGRLGDVRIVSFGTLALVEIAGDVYEQHVDPANTAVSAVSEIARIAPVPPSRCEYGDAQVGPRDRPEGPVAALPLMLGTLRIAVLEHLAEQVVVRVDPLILGHTCLPVAPECLLRDLVDDASHPRIHVEPEELPVLRFL